MERTKSANNDTGVIRWKKIGGGSLRFRRNEIIKPGQIFKARPDEIPQAFRDVIIPMESIPGDTSSAAPVHKVVEPVYTLKPRGSGGWYDVVDANGKALNEKALKKETAEKLVNDLAK